ncbi:MAG TPA: hypothetical protein VKE22_11565 [Haliangiales bacterium]|nr:hypothetical protein [Haliangiales bacterium]
MLSACPSPECADGWKPVLGALDRSVLSIFARGGDTFLVGGGLGAGGALALRWDGATTSEIATGRAETLWWVWGTGADVWMVGERGLILRGDGRTFGPMASDVDATLYGVWGTGADDVWIVGGNPGQGSAAANDVVLHWSGGTLAPAGPPRRGLAFFKVWGAGGEMWVAGEGGALWRRAGGAWEDRRLPTSSSITTVHGCGANDVWAVVGQSVWHYDGAWTSVHDTLSIANGVACGAAGVLVVGNGGLKLRYVGGVWHDDTGVEPFGTDFHAAWVAPGGQMWAGGGNFNTPPPVDRKGVVGVYGCPAP